MSPSNLFIISSTQSACDVMDIVRCDVICFMYFLLPRYPLLALTITLSENGVSSEYCGFLYVKVGKLTDFPYGDAAH